MRALKARRPREQVYTLAAPLRGVLSGPEPANFGGVENGFDPAAKALRRCRHASSVRRQHGEHGGNINRIDGLVPE